VFVSTCSSLSSDKHAIPDLGMLNTTPKYSLANENENEYVYAMSLAKISSSTPCYKTNKQSGETCSKLFLAIIRKLCSITDKLLEHCCWFGALQLTECLSWQCIL
jgi:hypothetical protein